MDFKTKHEVYKAKFYYSQNNKGAFVELKTTPLEKLKEMREECIGDDLIEYPINPQTGKMQRVVTPDFDEEKFLDMILDESICSWGGWRVDGGKELECNLENKVMLVRTFPDFSKFYTKSLTKHREDAEKKFGSKSVTKNSKTTRRTTSKP